MTSNIGVPPGIETYFTSASTQINPNNYGEKTRLKLKTQGVSSLKKSVGLRSKLMLASASMGFGDLRRN